MAFGCLRLGSLVSTAGVVFSSGSVMGELPLGALSEYTVLPFLSV